MSAEASSPSRATRRGGGQALGRAAGRRAASDRRWAGAGRRRVRAEVVPAARRRATRRRLPSRSRSSQRGRRCRSASRTTHLLVIAKPAGLITHPTEHATFGHARQPAARHGGPAVGRRQTLRPGIVHRLDAGTRGSCSSRRPTRRTRRWARCCGATRWSAYLALVVAAGRARSVRGRRAPRTPGRADRRGPQRGAGRPRRGSRCGSDPRRRRCSRHRRGPGGPTRSACTCGRSAIRSSAIAPTGEGATTRGRSGSSGRSCTRGGSRSTTPSPAGRSTSRNRSPTTSPRRWREGPRPAALTPPEGRA